jgi:hypothetical protein
MTTNLTPDVFTLEAIHVIEAAKDTEHRGPRLAGIIPGTLTVDTLQYLKADRQLLGSAPASPCSLTMDRREPSYISEPH